MTAAQPMQACAIRRSVIGLVIVVSLVIRRLRRRQYGVAITNSWVSLVSASKFRLTFVQSLGNVRRFKTQKSEKSVGKKFCRLVCCRPAPLMGAPGRILWCATGLRQVHSERTSTIFKTD
jgi:hypothetical protein